MKNKAAVAVLIVNYNSTELLKKCLFALSKQTITPDQILVVDNGGQQLLPESFENDYPQVKFIRLKNNIGFAAANNLAVKEVVGCEWIALLNPDAFPESDWLEKLLNAAEQNPEYDFFGSHMLCADNPEVLDGMGDAYHVSGRAWRRGIGCKAVDVVDSSGEIFSPCAAAALYKKDVFLAVGGFDENYFCYFEDVDLGFRLRLLGHRCLYVSDAIVHHVGSATTGKKSDFYVYHGQRNLVWTYIKNMPGLLFWLYLPQHISLNLFSLFWFSLRGQSRVIMKAKWDACRKISRVWQLRNSIQRNRKVTIFKLRQLMAKGLPLRHDKR